MKLLVQNHPAGEAYPISGTIHMYNLTLYAEGAVLIENSQISMWSSDWEMTYFLPEAMMEYHNH